MTQSTISAARALMLAHPVIAIAHVSKLEHAVPLARALVAGGLRVIEVTVRTDVAIEAAAAMAKQVPEAIVGLGTVTKEDHLKAAADHGLKFAVSPGLVEKLVVRAQKLNIPILPGAVTPSEIMIGMDLGLNEFKFFPVETSGGVAGLNYMAGPFADAMFCPTGIINQENRDTYLALPNVPCVGGSWMIKKDAVAAGDWATITAAARRAAVARPADQRKAS